MLLQTKFHYPKRSKKKTCTAGECHDLASLQHFCSALTPGIPAYRSNEIGKYLNIFATKDKMTHGITNQGLSVFSIGY
jgi:hypothetical protein